MNTLIRFFNPFAHGHSHDALYDIVENDVIKSKDFSGLTLSGSLFSLSVFKNVTFSSCVFFGSRLENCTFIDCKFIDCSFQFSTLEHCTFEQTEFSGCTWDVTRFKRNLFRASFLDYKTSHFAGKSEARNEFSRCVLENASEVNGNAELETGEIVEGGSVESLPTLPPLPTEDNGETRTIFIGSPKAA